MSKPKRTPAVHAASKEEGSSDETPTVPETPIARLSAGAITIDRWEQVTKSAKNQALITSFAVSERLAHGATRKLTPDEWRGAFDAWCARPRI